MTFRLDVRGGNLTHWWKETQAGDTEAFQVLIRENWPRDKTPV